jgi:hypothetical protein
MTSVDDLMMNVDLAGHHGRFLSFDVGARATK